MCFRIHFFAFFSSGIEVAGRSVSDHVPQADHTHCVLDITRKEYIRCMLVVLVVALLM